MSRKTYSNEDITKIIKGMFPQFRLMFAYYCGSKAYGTEDENSDIDVTAVFAGLTGNVHVEAASVDLFVYGEDCFLEKQKLNDTIPLYNLIFIDDVLSIDKNLIYSDPDYIDQLNAYKNIDFKQCLRPFLQNFLTYFSYHLTEYPQPAKRMYHVLRMRGLLDHYDNTGRYELVIEEPWKSRMIKYKGNWNNEVGIAYSPMIQEQIEYLKNYLDRM